MQDLDTTFWSQLFPAEPGQHTSTRDMRLLRKGGRPFLLLPPRGAAAIAALGLYPAQTRRARALRTLLGYFLKFGLPLGTKTTRITISPDDPFVKFLASMARQPQGSPPEFGILAGNPAQESQRVLVLLFGPNKEPAAVVKCGSTAPARALVQNEARFLSTATGKAEGLPRLRGDFESPRLRALALDFFPGDSPARQGETAFPPLLGSWIDSSTTVQAITLAGWTRLMRQCAGNQDLAVLGTRLEKCRLHPAIYHGDFVPWNIRVSPQGQWIVLDWERGELAGMPAWDVFHYVLQTAILVERQPLPALVARVQGLMNSEPFRNYTRQACINGFERELLLTYLLHCAEVIKPSEGLTETKALYTALWTKWMA